jgi:cytochrome c oxidase subunit 2
VTAIVAQIAQSAFDPRGPQSARIEVLWWTMFWAGAVVWLLVVAATLWAAFRPRAGNLPVVRETHPEVPRHPNDPPRPHVPADTQRRMTVGVAGATAVTVLVLLGFLGFSYATGRAYTAPYDPRALQIEVVAQQWWWEVRYGDPVAQNRVMTANEIYVPVGRPVLLRLSSRDVIHSFWVPNLAGKRDQIPGKTSTMWFQADTPGVYRGQCAEFCGYQHAKMAFVVVAVSPAEFESWYRRQLLPALPPTDSVTARGQQVFLQSACIMCHNVTGTPAGASFGPDLTHLASRRTIGAGSLPNTRGNLAAWILDPQRIKPGVRMPPNQLEPRDLHALLAYLESLE